jgi:MFS transporter, FSR family, fosmidomycin resistance protein
VALTPRFAGGAAGRLVCGFLEARLGMLPTVVITEGATAAGILALLPLPIDAALALLPVIGVALNGTSSILYGTVPDLVPLERRSHAFGVFYTGRSAPAPCRRLSRLSTDSRPSRCSREA